MRSAVLLVLTISFAFLLASCDLLPDGMNTTLQPDAEYNLHPLIAPTVALEGDTAFWSADANAERFEISIDGSTSYLENTSCSIHLDAGQSFQIRAIGDGVNYTDSAWSNSVTYTIASDEEETTLYTVVWKDGERTIGVNYDVPEGAVIKYRGETPTKVGYSFAGWKSDNLIAGPEIAEDFVIVIQSNWNLLEFTISYHANGGILPEGLTTVYTVEDELVTIGSPSYSRYPDYNRFVGWYEDEELTIPFNRDLKAAPANLDLYAKWSLCLEFDVTNTPTLITGECVIIDWSNADDGSYALSKAFVLKNVRKAYFIGNPDAIYTNFVINIYIDGSVDESTELRFDNLNMQGYICKSAESEPLDLALYCFGDNRINAPSSNSAIFGFSSVGIFGDGNLSVFGGDGADAVHSGYGGADGADAIVAEQVNIGLNGALNVFGGNGGNGRYGAGNQAGGKGGNGGAAIRCTLISISNTVIANICGGNGGDGGLGGNGSDGANGVSGNSASDNGGWNNDASNGTSGKAGTRGGNGGNGGDGGAALITEALYNQSTAIGLLGGNGGNGGNGGAGGDGGDGGRGGADDWWGPGLNEPGDGGNGGRGGNGGNGGVGGNRGVACTISVQDTGINASDGLLGSGGLGGKGGIGGFGGKGGNGGNYGSNGSYGKDGSNGADGYDGGTYAG